MMNDKLNAGGQSDGTWRKYRIIVEPVTFIAGPANGRLFSTGPTIVGNYN